MVSARNRSGLQSVGADVVFFVVVKKKRSFLAWLVVSQARVILENVPEIRFLPSVERL